MILVLFTNFSSLHSKYGFKTIIYWNGISTSFLQPLNCPLHRVGRYFEVEKQQLPEKGYLFPFTRANFCHQNNGLSPSEKQLKNLRSLIWKIYIPSSLGSASISCAVYYNILLNLAYMLIPPWPGTFLPQYQT